MVQGQTTNIAAHEQLKLMEKISLDVKGNEKCQSRFDGNDNKSELNDKHCQGRLHQNPSFNVYWFFFSLQ